MKKLISELREFIKTQYIDDRVLSRLEPIVKKMEAEITRKPKPKKSEKFVVFMDNESTTLIRKKNICLINFNKESFEKVYILLNNGESGVHKIDENKEVLENLIKEFKVLF